ncbi:MAG: RdgB/HAM1 family non-canonical purine NTP pyrophosphatase [Candidatus Latescibacterota bacterium]|nr:RdgB/HAM1 family non-canonical purine NTP pyrophosphatase [Candidatus Latescibacterota bacterium]
MPLLVATGNVGKLRELRAMLTGLRVVGPDEAGIEVPPVEETGDTFAANARLKARAFSQASGLITLADDSGLEVDALDGRPGVLSARYGGPGLSDRDRCELLLTELTDVETERRTARFRCCLLAVAPVGQQCQVEGSCEGRIYHELRGEQGFGYDPVFYLPNLERTMAELTAEEKNRISHRGEALRALREPLLRTFSELANEAAD